MAKSKRILPLIITIFALCAFMIGMDYWQSSRQSGTIKIDGTYKASLDPLHFTLSDSFIFTPLIMQDTATTFANLKGRAVLINVWASWCAPCVKEMPQLIELANTRNDLSLVLLSVDEDREAAKTFLKRFETQMSHNIILAWDPERTMSTANFQTYRYPETILVRPDGAVSGKIVGLVDWTDPGIARMINRLTATANPIEKKEL